MFPPPLVGLVCLIQCSGYLCPSVLNILLHFHQTCFLQNFLTICWTPPCFFQPFPFAAPLTAMVIAGSGILSVFTAEFTTITFFSRYRSTAGRPKMCKNSPRRHTCKRSFENVWHLLTKTASMSRLGWASLYVLAFDGWVVVQLGKHELLCFGWGLVVLIDIVRITGILPSWFWQSLKLW